MRESQLFGAFYAGLLCVLATTPETSKALIINDGGSHLIDYAVTNGLDMNNGTTVTLETGANISGESTSNSNATIQSEGAASLIINDGLVQGNVNAFNTDLVITGGTINGNLGIYYSDATISGGTINSMFSEAASHIDISGGTFGDIGTISGSYDITGGHFLGLLDIDYDLFATMTIKGGNFSSGFSYYGGAPYLTTIDNFIFYGDLMLDTPSLVGMNGGFPMYETMISGTLDDGTAISQRITCTDFNINNDPCGRVKIVPSPPVNWLVGPGLLLMTIGSAVRGRRTASRFRRITAPAGA